MPTKRELIGDAFAEIGIGNWEFDLQPDEIQNAVRRMDAMVASWSTRGIWFGYNQTSDDPDTDSGVPDAAKLAVVLSVAVQIAPGFCKQLSPNTLGSQREAFDVMAGYFSTIPQRVLPSTMPRGAGNKPLRYGVNNQFYPGLPGCES